MELNKLLLKNVDTKKLSKMMMVSATTTLSSKTNVVNMVVFENGDLESASKDNSESLYKLWKMDKSDYCESIISDGEVGSEGIKISIYNGSNFSKTILGYFGQLVDIEIQHDGVSSKNMVLRKYVDDRKSLEVNITNASSDLSFIDISDIERAIAFGNDDELLSENSLELVNESQFSISGDEISYINKLSGSTFSEELQQKYISFDTIEGVLYAKDGGFESALKDKAFILSTSFEIQKDLLSIVDVDDYDCRVNTITSEDGDSSKILTFVSKKDNILISITALSDIGEGDYMGLMEDENENSSFE